MKRRYKDLLGIILIGSFAEDTYQKDSDIDIVFIKERRAKYRNLYKLTEDTKRRIQLIPFTRKDVNQHFEDSTTMAYAIQRGKIIYQKKNSLEKYYNWILEWPNKEWMDKWFKHWLGIYDMGLIAAKYYFDKYTRIRTIGLNFSLNLLDEKSKIQILPNPK